MPPLVAKENLVTTFAIFKGSSFVLDAVLELGR